MQTYQPSLFARPDTILGVCEAIGEDLGFNPTYLRVALATTVFFNFTAAIVIYLAAGVIVAATRWAYPAARKLAVVKEAAPVTPAADTAPVEAQNDQDRIPMAAAA